MSFMFAHEQNDDIGTCLLFFLGRKMLRKENETFFSFNRLIIGYSITLNDCKRGRWSEENEGNKDNVVRDYNLRMLIAKS